MVVIWNLRQFLVAFNVHGETKAERERALATSGQHQPRPMPFDPAKLKGLFKKLIRSHWENNYGRAVTALNAIEQRLLLRC